jgi:hypothetical protein
MQLTEKNFTCKECDKLFFWQFKHRDILIKINQTNLGYYLILKHGKKTIKDNFCLTYQQALELINNKYLKIKI